jgi:hypothetical protein
LHRAYSQRQMEGEWFELTTEEASSFPHNCKKIDGNIEFLKLYKI